MAHSSRNEPVPADLLREEFTAPGGALVVRQGRENPAAIEEVDGERLSAQGGYGIELAAHVPQGRLGGGDFRDVAEVPAYPVRLRRRELAQHLLEHLAGPALVGGNAKGHAVPVETDDLDRHGIDVDADVRHSTDRPWNGSSPWGRRTGA